MHDHRYREEQRALRACERRYRKLQEEGALPDAVRICEEHGIKYPAWLRSELLKLGRAVVLGMGPKKKQRRPKNVLRNFLWHSLVQYYRSEGLRGEQLWNAVVAELEALVHPGDPDLRINTHKKHAKQEDELGAKTAVVAAMKMGLREHRKRIKMLGSDEEIRLKLQSLKI